MVPKTIEIFLPDGEPTGVRIAEVKNRTVQLVAFPRAKLSGNLGIDREGVYFLFGTDEESGDRPLVYIGQAKDCLNRIRQHHQNPAKDYWNTAVVFITTNRSFGTTEIEYLEQLAVNQAKKASRFIVKNGVIPPTSSLSVAQRAQMEEVFECLELLLPVIGYPVFSEAAVASTANDVLICEGNGVQAEARYTDAGMVVLKGSQMRVETTPALSKGVLLLRERLIEQGIVALAGGKYVFLEDYPFSSPSMASAAILGSTLNGWKRWKSREGKTMDELIRSTYA